MPFDSTTFRQPKVTVLPPQEPPQPPERGGRPMRVVVNIEIVDRRTQAPQARRGYRFGTLTLTLLALALLAALAGCTAAQAQPSSWQSYQQGFTRHYQGTDANGGQWTGQSFKNGDGTMQFDAYGPDGQTQHCRRHELSGTTHTECQ